MSTKYIFVSLYSEKGTPPKKHEKTKFGGIEKDLDTICADATCYESEMRYPTDQKLLWKTVHLLRNPHHQCGATRRADDRTAKSEANPFTRCKKGTIAVALTIMPELNDNPYFMITFLKWVSPTRTK